MPLTSLPYDDIELPEHRVVVTKSRRDGLDEHGKPFREPLPGSLILPAPTDLTEVQSRRSALLEELHLNPKNLYLAAVVGGPHVAFIDSLENEQVSSVAGSYTAIEKTDGLFGYRGSTKACYLGDCGLLVGWGIDKSNKPFDGFIHTTRLNMNGDGQFHDEHDQPVGGVELMLRQVVAHYQPREFHLQLVAGIGPQFYLHEFQISDAEQAKEPELTPEIKRERGFKGWYAQGWMRKHRVDGRWDGITYEVDLYAAIRHQVARAGLETAYDDQQIALDGNPASGHASHRAAKRGLVDETRDLYVLTPKP